MSALSSKIATAAWFARQPSFWAHGAALAVRKFRPNRDLPELRSAARNWASERAVGVQEALESLGLHGPVLRLETELIALGEDRARTSQVRMGGPGDLQLLFAAVRMSGAMRVVETGVAYGWSSLAILAAMEGRLEAKLVSVDMPYPKMGNEAFVGVVVPERLRGPWTLLREPDRRGVEKAIALFGGAIDLCHYDSDKSWWGRHYAFPLLWAALKPGGIFISDDIQDNLYFAEFAARTNAPFAVTEFSGKYVGILRKPPSALRPILPT